MPSSENGSPSSRASAGAHRQGSSSGLLRFRQCQCRLPQLDESSTLGQSDFRLNQHRLPCDRSVTSVLRRFETARGKERRAAPGLALIKRRERVGPITGLTSSAPADVTSLWLARRPSAETTPNAFGCLPSRSTAFSYDVHRAWVGPGSR